jgi:hypothetical protein
MRTETHGPHRRVGVGLLLAVLSLAACGETPDDGHVADEPASIEYVDGSDLAHITLTEQAIERLDLRTAAALQDAGLIIVPSGAVIVDPQGGMWVYTSIGPRLFVRERINVDHEERDLAYLSEGPSEGTEVVTVAVAQLWGIESGIGH